MNTDLQFTSSREGISELVNQQKGHISCFTLIKAISLATSAEAFTIIVKDGSQKVFPILSERPLHERRAIL